MIAGEPCPQCGAPRSRRGVALLLLLPLVAGLLAVAVAVVAGDSLSPFELLAAITAVFALLILGLGPLARRLLRTAECEACEDESPDAR